MADPKDNYITPDKKAKWSFSGSVDEIKVGTEKAEGEESVTTTKTEKTGRGNGSK